MTYFATRNRYRSIGTGAIAAIFVAWVSILPISAQTLDIYHIDVEQGDATLFVSPNGRTMLVDAGQRSDGDRIKAVMDEAGVDRINVFVLTHYHLDHYGGIDDLVPEEDVTVDTVFDRGDRFEPSVIARLSGARGLEYDTTIGYRATQLQRGRPVPFDPGTVSVTCISMGGTVIGEDPPVWGVNENDMSISLLVQMGDFRYFTGGDLDTITEEKIADRNLVLDVDVCRSNHHGSHTSSLDSFMVDLSPSVIIISNGNRADYMHPRLVTLATYESLSPRPTVLQTNKYFRGGLGGNVPDKFIADLQTSATSGTIKVSVDPSTDSYSVSYRDTIITYAIKDRGESSGTVVIESLLPNPDGSDWDLEEVALRNDGAEPVDMAGWFLRDESERVWALASMGTIEPGQTDTIMRGGMPMSLNNNHDVITLFGSDNLPVDSVSYVDPTEGVWIQGH